MPLAVLAALVLRLPVPRAFAWHFVHGDCWARGVWLHDRIAGSEAPIDVAFVGTSRTILSIDDAAIEKDLARHGLDWKVANLGYCRNGRNLQVAIARDLLAARRVRHLVVEVSNREFPTSHPVYGYVARSDDLWARPLDRGFEYLSDAYHGFLTRWDLAKTRLLALPLPATRPPDEVFGHAGQPGANEAFGDLPRLLADTRSRRLARAEARGAPSAGRSRLGHAELRYLAGLAAATGTRLHFLYMQSYGEPWERIWSRDVYESLGDVWVPPRPIFEDPSLWWDPHHLNTDGAAALSAWLAERLEQER